MVYICRSISAKKEKPVQRPMKKEQGKKKEKEPTKRQKEKNERKICRMKRTSKTQHPDINLEQ